MLNAPIRLCSSDRLTPPCAISSDDNQIVLVQLAVDQPVRGYRNQCPHRKIRLNHQNDQFLDEHGQHLQCMNHGALFEVSTGRCIAGPCTGQALDSVPVFVCKDGVYCVLGRYSGG